MKSSEKNHDKKNAMKHETCDYLICQNYSGKI